MDTSVLACQSEQRRYQVRRHPELNGLDYLEVSGDRVLTVYFLGKAPRGLKKENVQIRGGRRVQNIRVTAIEACRSGRPDIDDCLTVVLDRPGDFSTYTLCLVELDEAGRPTDRPLSGFDPRYACLDFTFRVDCPSDFDCKPAGPLCPPEVFPQSDINYLAKDYASFRQLILDRLALLMPEWQERHVPDIGITLVEVLAYVGDYLSYYQDAVGTEAYLDTARQRISVRRHVRLIDYPMHEGTNARAWLYLATDGQVSLEAERIYFITGYNNVLRLDDYMLAEEDLRDIPKRRYEVFEPLLEGPVQEIDLYPAHNEIHIYTWGDEDCCLSRGTTSATLVDGAAVETDDAASGAEQSAAPKEVTEQPPAVVYQRELNLKVGNFLLFEEVIGPKTGSDHDADPAHRHVVRLTKVEKIVDELYQQPLLEVAWAEADALPFSLCISAIGPAPACDLIENISVARGNLILVDHGRRIDDETLGAVPVKETAVVCLGKGQPDDVAPLAGRFRPRLAQVPVVFSQPPPAAAAAADLFTQDPRQALPWITLSSGLEAPPDGDMGDEETPDEGNSESHTQAAAATSTGPDASTLTWLPQRDLLASQAQDRHFVAEIDNEGRANLRFGDGELGQQPSAGSLFGATYRVGGGSAGNVGAEAISHLILRPGYNPTSGVTIRPRNPLPAQGGIAPEPLSEVKLFAAYAFRHDIQRAITPADYVELAEHHPQVQKAAATLRWTGSWYEVLVAIDPLGSVTADEALLAEISGYLYPFRRIGHDVLVVPARYVPLDLGMSVCVKPGYLRGHVKAALLARFSNRMLPTGQLGFFHPDNLTFAEDVSLSPIIAAAQAVAGVESVQVTRLQRYGESSNDKFIDGYLPIGPMEVARLDNDPSQPENGKLELEMKGGR